jgi:WD40 repeat protein
MTGLEAAHVTQEGGITSATISPDGSYILTTSETYARIWKATGGTTLSLYHNSSVASVAFSPDGKYAATGSDDYTARVWDAATGIEITLKTFESSVSSVAFSPDGKYLLSLECVEFDDLSNCIDQNAHIWEISTGAEFSQITQGAEILAIAFSPDGNYVATAGYDNTARVWEASTGKEIARVTHSRYVTAVAFSPDGKYVVSSGFDARVWEADTGFEILRVTLDQSVDSVAFSPDGQYIVTGSNDDTARVWEIATSKEISQVKFVDGVSSVSFSPDGKWVVSASWNNTIQVWEAATGKEISRMTHDDGVISVVFSPDGNYVLSMSLDKSARVWETDTGIEVARVTHDQWVSSVAFSPDGKYVISGGGDSLARIWEWQPEDLISNSCANLPRNLTRNEWNQYIGDALPFQAVCDNLPLEGEGSIATTEAVSEAVPDKALIDNETSTAPEESQATDLPSSVPTSSNIESTATIDPILLGDSSYLTTKFLESKNKCLEGNQVASDSFLGGAAFMDDCGDSPGQFWEMVLIENGYFLISPLSSVVKCLEGNRVSSDAFLGGAAYLNDCDIVPGQLWKMIPVEDEYFYLTTQVLEAENKCLEGNRVSEDSFLGGAAFMNDCTNVSGQLWKMVPVQ